MPNNMSNFFARGGPRDFPSQTCGAVGCSVRSGFFVGTIKRDECRKKCTGVHTNASIGGAYTSGVVKQSSFRIQKTLTCTCPGLPEGTMLFPASLTLGNAFIVPRAGLLGCDCMEFFDSLRKRDRELTSFPFNVTLNDCLRGFSLLASILTFGNIASTP